MKKFPLFVELKRDNKIHKYLVVQTYEGDDVSQVKVYSMKNNWYIINSGEMLKTFIKKKKSLDDIARQIFGYYVNVVNVIPLPNTDFHHNIR